jgi:ABC-type polysaccharide transport system permease subunit
VPTIVNGAMWRWIYSADFGALNGLLMQLGLIQHYVPWLTLPNMALNLVILADLWHTMPFVALILQAALATLPAEMEEGRFRGRRQRLAALLVHPPALTAPGYPGGADRPHRGRFPCF